MSQLASPSVELVEQIAKQAYYKNSQRILSVTGVSIVVPSNRSYNLLEAYTDPSYLISNEDNLVYTYSGETTGGGLVVHFPYVADVVDVSVKLQLTGTINSATGFRMWGYLLIYGGESVAFEEKQGFKFTPYWGVNRNTIDFQTGMRGANDPLITKGVRIMLNNTETVDMTITGIRITTTLKYWVNNA